MNASRRKEIQEVLNDLENIESRISGLADDEQEYYDNMPESFQQGEKGERAQTAADALNTARDACSEVASSLEEALEA